MNIKFLSGILGYLIVSLLIIGCRLGDVSGSGSTVPHLYHIGELNTDGFSYALTVSGNRVYLADGVHGLRIIDITSPHFPQELDSYEDDGIYYDVKYSGGDYVYVSAGEAGFKIIDVTSPFGAELVGQFTTHNAFGLDYAGQYVYIADFVGGIRILDISNHFNIYEISNFTVDGQHVNNVTVKWPNLYASCRYGFSIVNIDNPFSPVQLHFEELNNVYDIEIVNHLAYVAYEGGLQIYDVSNPEDPQKLGFYHLPATARSIKVRDIFAYLAIGGSGLSIINISNPNQPFEIAYHNPVTGQMSDIEVFGRYLFIANGEAGLLILEFQPGIKTRD